MGKALSVNVDSETQQRLSFIGESASLAELDLAETAIKDFTREKERFIKAVRQGQDDVQAGRITSHKDLMEDLESRLADLG